MTSSPLHSLLEKKIRSIPDFPKPGIIFRDITTLLKDAHGFRAVIDYYVDRYRDKAIDNIAGIESRGFIFGGALAYELGAGFIPVRKPGKLPAATIRREYTLEYGEDALEIHTDAVSPGEKVLIVDDLIATGGTAKATAELFTEAGAEIHEIALIIELVDLHGREQLKGFPVHSLVTYLGA